MSRQDDAEKVLPELLHMIDSDLMEASHYLKKAVAVAIVAEDKPQAERIARYHVELEEFLSRFELVVMRPTPRTVQKEET